MGSGQLRAVRLGVALIGCLALGWVVAADASAKPFIYVPDYGTSNVSAFEANDAGQLSLLPGSRSPRRPSPCGALPPRTGSTST